MSLTQTSGSVSSDGAVLSTYAARCHPVNPRLLSACLKKKSTQEVASTQHALTTFFLTHSNFIQIYIYLLLSFAPIM